MRTWLTSAALIAGMLFAGTSGADAQSVMKVCGDQWKAAKAAGTTNGETWPQFLAQCRAQLNSGGAAVAPAPAQSGSLFPWQQPAAPSPTPASSTANSGNGQSVMRQCGAQWQAAKAAGTTGGATWPQFLKQCRSQLAPTSVPQTGFAPAPAPAPASQSGSLFPWQQPAAPAAPAPTPANYGNPAPTGAGQFASEQEARYRCPSDTIVWVNERSHIYHFPGTSNYGHTKRGAFMCEADAKAGGARAAMNEHHP
jgi:hypothetical protein